MKAIITGSVYTPDQVLAPGTILIEEGHITAVGSADTLAVPPAEVIDAKGEAVVPGFIDVHMHGLMGHDGMGPGLAHIIRDLPSFGVTAFLATTLTLPRDETFADLKAMLEGLDAPPAELGEFPGISADSQGPHPHAHLCPGSRRRDGLHPTPD